MENKFTFFDAVKKFFKYAENNKKLYTKAIIFMAIFVIGQMIYVTH